MYTAKLGSSDGGMITDEVVAGQTHAQVILILLKKDGMFSKCPRSLYFSSLPAESKPN
jgi:hypothetical protein